MAKKPMGKSGVADTGYSEVLTYPSTEICQTPSGDSATIPALVGHGQVFAVPLNVEPGWAGRNAFASQFRIPHSAFRVPHLIGR